jgi:predicted dehydrogenase
MKGNSVNRRRFLQAAGVSLVGFPTVVPSSVWGRPSPSERITIGAIGLGPRCEAVMKHFFTFPDFQWLAVCDVQLGRLDRGKGWVDEHHQNGNCLAYTDFRELLANEQIDAVLIATGDRWHALASILAAQAGKDIYSEKPMSLTIEEGRAVVSAMKRYGSVYQCGHQRRSVDSYRFQNEIVRSGMIGRVHTVIAQNWENPVVKPDVPGEIPPGLDYDMWLGPTPYHPFIPTRFREWNYYWDTGGGTLINMGCHYTDIAQWGFDTDDTGPVHYDGTAEFHSNNAADTPVRAEVTCAYADGRKLILKSRGTFPERYIRFEGSEGWIQVDDETDLITADPPSILRIRGSRARGWEAAGDHIKDFLDCIRSRRETICSPEKSHRATTIGHIANACCRLGRSLEWDPSAERFVDDPQADRTISRSMRHPWRL